MTTEPAEPPGALETARRYFAPWRVAEILHYARLGMLPFVRASLVAGSFGAAGTTIWLSTSPKGVTAAYSHDGPEVLHSWAVLFAAVTDQAKARPQAAARLREACAEHTAVTQTYLDACSRSPRYEVSPEQQAASDAQLVAHRAVRDAFDAFWVDGPEADAPGQLDLFADLGVGA